MLAYCMKKNLGEGNMFAYCLKNLGEENMFVCCMKKTQKKRTVWSKFKKKVTDGMLSC